MAYPMPEMIEQVLRNQIAIMSALVQLRSGIEPSKMAECHIEVDAGFALAFRELLDRINESKTMAVVRLNGRP